VRVDVAVSDSTGPEDAAEAVDTATVDTGAASGPGRPEDGPGRAAGPAADPATSAEAPAEPGASQDEGSDQDGDSEEPKNSFAALVGNTTLFTAVLVYMGWNYENSLLEYFRVPAFSVNIGTIEFALKGLVPLFDSDVVFFAALLVAVLGLASKASAVRGLVPKAVSEAVGRVREPADRVMIMGLLVTAAVLPLTWANVSAGTFVGWFASHRDGVYFVLALLVAGQLLSVWPIRRSGTGALAYPLALIVAAMCTLWAAGIYAGSLGSQAARSFAMGLPGQTAVTVYSVTSLALSGPGVTCQRVPGATGYPYACTGLRLLYVQSGTYDLLPVRWTSQGGHTIILDDSNQIRIELSPGS
jgi:hypothetical protein